MYSPRKHRDHLRLNCEDKDALLDSEAFMSQLEDDGGGTGAPRPGSRPVEVLLPGVLTGGAAWDEGSWPKPGPLSCSRIWAPALGWGLLAWPKSPKPAPRTEDWWNKTKKTPNNNSEVLNDYFWWHNDCEQQTKENTNKNAAFFFIFTRAAWA